jgi:hypothetical protein
MSILEELEFILGPSTSVKVFTEIEEEYLGNELDILDAIITRRDLVERAIASILGDPGRIIFRQALKNAHVRAGSGS